MWAGYHYLLGLVDPKESQLHKGLIGMGSLITFGLIVVYGGGVWKFWNGFYRTNFSQGRLYLSLLWPFLLTSKSYRQNFRRALKG